MIHGRKWRHNYDDQIEFSVAGSKSLIFGENIGNRLINNISKICRRNLSFRLEMSDFVFRADDSARDDSFLFRGNYSTLSLSEPRFSHNGEEFAW